MIEYYNEITPAEWNVNARSREMAVWFNDEYRYEVGDSGGHISMRYETLRPNVPYKKTVVGYNPINKKWIFLLPIDPNDFSVRYGEADHCAELLDDK